MSEVEELLATARADVDSGWLLIGDGLLDVTRSDLAAALTDLPS